jgi:hypothetical protein
MSLMTELRNYCIGHASISRFAPQSAACYKCQEGVQV